MTVQEVPVVRARELFRVPRLPLLVARTAQASNPLHTHDFVEIVLVARGRAMHERHEPRTDAARAETSDRRAALASYEIVENDVLFLTPWALHAYSRCESLEIYNVLFSPALLEGEALRGGGKAGGLFELLTAPRSGPPDPLVRYKLRLKLVERQAVESCLRSIIQELAGRQHRFELIARCKLLEALAILDRAFCAPRGAASAAPELAGKEGAVYQAITYMENHLAQPLTLEAIADVARLSPHYFCELFKTTTGLPPGRYLTQLRIEHARQLLITTALPITEVAGRCGFCDSSHFARVFKSATGVSPRLFRQSGTPS